MKKSVFFRTVGLLLCLLTLCCIISCANTDDHAHQWSEWSTLKEATCKETGTKIRSCTICAITDTATLPLADHAFEIQSGKPATCTETGAEAGKLCTVCGYAKGGTIPALGHDYIDHPGKEPTSSSVGWNAYQTCARCDYTTYKEIQPHQHQLKNHEGKTGSCTEDGWDPYVTCDSCTYTTYKLIPAPGHKWEVKVLTKPTASAAGQKADVCKTCGEMQNVSSLPAILDPKGNFSPRYVTVGTPMTYDLVGVDPSNLRFTWAIGGKVVSNTHAYTPDASCLEQYLQVTVADLTGRILIIDKIFCSRLPVFYIDTKDNQPITSKTVYLPGTVTMQGSSAYPDSTTPYYSGNLEIRGRGNSTWNVSDFKKKAYKIKLESSSDLFGYGKSKHWILLANYIDESLVRNYIAYSAGDTLGLTTMESTWVEVILNGEHLGVFQLCEQIKIDNDRVDIQSWENLAEDLAKEIYKAYQSQGFTKEQQKQLEDALIQDLSWASSGKFNFNSKSYTVSDYLALPPLTGGLWIEMSSEFDEISKFTTTQGAPIMFKDPEYLTTNSALFNYAKAYIQAFEDALYSANATTSYNGQTVSVWDMADLESAVRFWMVSDFFRNEIGGKSTHMYKDIGGKIVFGPVWDFDFAAGSNSPWGTQATTGWHCRSRKWFGQMMKNEDFIEAAYEVYPIFRAYIENTIKDGGLMDEYYAYIKEAAEVNDDLWYYKRGFETDFNWFRAWMTERLEWYDEQFKDLETLKSSMATNNTQGTTPSLGTENNNRVGVEILDSNGKQLLINDASGKATVTGTKGNQLTLPAGTDKLIVKVNIYSTTAIGVDLYINGKQVATQAAQMQSGAQYKEFEITADQLKSGQNEIRILVRRQPHGPYQNTVYLKK